MGKKTLTVVTDSPGANADVTPAGLGPDGTQLWRRVQGEYGIVDAAGVTLLELACRAMDRAAKCRRTIDEAGHVVKTASGPKEHPLIRSEISAMALASRLLQRLNLDVEPLRSGPGRPPSNQATAY